MAAIADDNAVLDRVVITWPAARQSASGPLPLIAWGIRVDDADTGESILDGFTLELRIALGTENGFDGGRPIEAELIRLVDAEGVPIGNGPDSGAKIAYTDAYAEYRKQRGLDQPHPPDDFPSDDFEGPRFRTGTFRYLVVEMRIAEPSP
jgi:hypothetical protein